MNIAQNSGYEEFLEMGLCTAGNALYLCCKDRSIMLLTEVIADYIENLMQHIHASADKISF